MLDKFLPPTDNLYKFVAISGLVLMALILVPNYFSFLLTERTIEVGHQAKVFGLEVDQFKEDSDRLIKELEELGIRRVALEKKIGNETIKGDIGNELVRREYKVEKYSGVISKANNERDRLEVAIEENEAAAEKVRSDLNDKQFAIKMKSEQLDSNTLVLDHYSDQLFQLHILTIFLLLSGLIMAPCGFYQWYRKVQRPLDLDNIAKSSINTNPLKNRRRPLKRVS